MSSHDRNREGRIWAAAFLAAVAAGCDHAQTEAPRAEPGSISQAAEPTQRLFAGIGEFVTHFGGFTPGTAGSPGITATSFSAAPNDGQHAEAARPGVLGADFTYSADVTLVGGADGHLQFRVSDEGRYGLRVSANGLQLYKQVRLPQELRPAGVPELLSWEPIGAASTARVSEDVPHRVTVAATGAHLTASLDGVALVSADDASLGAGRFGVYVWRPAGSSGTVGFANVIATADTTRPSNFALLYSTAGYESRGTKRALVRTLNAMPLGLVDLGSSRFTVLGAGGGEVASGPLRNLAPTFGMQLFEADFTSLTTPGAYTLRVDLKGPGQAQRLESAPFRVADHNFTTRHLVPMTLLNAEARRAADEDFRRNWRVQSGRWSVETDGAFRVDDADDLGGAVIERVLDGYGGPVDDFPQEFTLTGRVTIVKGCDAQLQFGINAATRLAVTLQAGSPGACAHGAGFGAIRLHVEGPGVPNGFKPLSAGFFTSTLPFEAGRPYDLRIEVRGGIVSAHIDGLEGVNHERPPSLNTQVPLGLNGPHGHFALKAWGSTARFEQVRLWRPTITVAHSPAVEPPRINGRSCFDFDKLTPSELGDCYPLFSQRTGFHDCNNYIAEVTSHGGFLAGLMETWSRRRASLSSADQERLRRAILTSVGYLENLYALYASNPDTQGRFAHEEYSRGAMNGGGPWSTLAGLYGEAAFAAQGADIDAALARTTCQHAWDAASWLAKNNALGDEQKALFYHQIATCARRDGITFTAAPATPDQLEAAAIAGGSAFISWFTDVNTLPAVGRDVGRMIPWFEGILALRQALPSQTAGWDRQLTPFAVGLVEYLTANNGFRVMPVAGGAGSPDPVVNQKWNEALWYDMRGVPALNRPILDGRSFYDVRWFSTTALDMVLLGRLTGVAGLEALAAGHIGWVLGINPGVPATKVIGPSAGGPVWRAAAFMRNLDSGGFARGFEGFMTAATSSKSRLSPWEENPTSVHREVWWVDPLDNGFMTLMNGQTIFEGEWDYHNLGEHGWLSGETFLLSDGLFTKAMLQYEDWLASPRPPPVPERTRKLVDTYYQNPGLRVHTLTAHPDASWSFTWQDVNSGYGANDMANWKVADVNGDGRADLVDTFFLGIGRGMRVHTLLSNPDGTWTFKHQDVNSGYGANDMANWKVADVDGDGRADLVDTYFLGVGYGMRVHTLLSNGDGTWDFEYQDVNKGYGANDMANWKVADVNGDGRADLVDTYFLGIGYGMRVHTLLSKGDGTWDFKYQDVNKGYGANDMANWKVADINGDGRADLVDAYFLGVGSGLRIHSLISHGDGTWDFRLDDINKGYGANDMANWKVMDVNGDGLADLVDTYFLGVGSGMRVHSALSRGDGTFAFHYQDVNRGYGTDDMANWKVAE